MTISKKEFWLPIFVLIAVGGFIYSFNLHNQLFWDDDDWIINNNFVHAISWDNVEFWLTHNTLAGVGLKSNYYRPFLFLTFAFNYVLAGVKPLVWHLTSNFIHIANSILVFSILYLVFRKRLVAFLTALIFLIHPLQTEAVTYISGRGDLLAVFFMLLALWLFIKSELSTSQVDSSRNYRLAMSIKLLSVVLLVLALLSRETGIIFPLFALAFYIAVLSKESFLRSIKIGLAKTWPYFAVVIIYGLLRLTVLNFLNVLNFFAEPNIYSENMHVRIFTFLPVLWGYLKLLIVPVGLHMERGSTVYTSLFQWPVWLIGLGIAVLLYCLIVMYRKEQSSNLAIQQYSNFRIWFLGISWFFIALLPVSGVTPINAVMYEHWLYLPMAGFWLIIAFYLVKIFDLLKSQKLSTYYFLLTTFLLVYLSFFGYQSAKRNIIWGNQEKFYQDILKYEPSSVRINNNLGNLYFDQKNVEKAEEYYRRAIDIGDIFPQPHYNIGSILQSRGDVLGAIKEYEKAIGIDRNFFYPYQNLAVIYAQRGDLPKAKENIEILKSLLPTNPRVFYNSALVYIALNNRAEAIADLKEGLRHSKLDLETGRLIEELLKKLQR